jgi:hypothetical protein
MVECPKDEEKSMMAEQSEAAEVIELKERDAQSP